MSFGKALLRPFAGSTVAVAVVAMPPAFTAPLEDISFLLNELVTPGDADYASYTCEPSDQFSSAVECRSETESSSQQLVSRAIVHSDDGKRLFASVHTTPTKLNRDAVAAEIQAFSDVIGSEPRSVAWSGDGDEWVNVIATWGQLEIEPDIVERLGIEAVFNVLDNPDDTLYRMNGEAGFAYVANLEEGGFGESYHVAARPDDLSIRHFRSTVAQVLTKDQALAPTDYSLWPDVALATRNLSLNVSPETANRELDDVFDAMGSEKLRSHVWAILPFGNIQRLREGRYWRYDTFGAETRYPEIIAAAEDFIAREPHDKFVDFAYYMLGDFQGALDANPNSVIASPLHHALGFQIVQRLVLEGLNVAKGRVTRYTLPTAIEQLDALLESDATTTDSWADDRFYVDSGLIFLNRHPELFDGKSLSTYIPEFAAAAAEARAHYGAASKVNSSADDAAFMSGWLARHVDELDPAAQFLSTGLQFTDDHADVMQADDEDLLNWIDYSPGLLKEAVRVVEALPAERRMPTVDGHTSFNSKPALWYAAARSVYREFDFASAGEIAQTALTKSGVSIDRLPTSTDPDRIYEALQNVDPALLDDYNFVELPYLLAASEEISDYISRLDDVARQDPQSLARQARMLVVKYSLLIDPPADSSVPQGAPVPEHKDLRQALRLIATTLEHTAGLAGYTDLREWLYYRQARILAVFRPLELGAAIAAMERDFPESELLDDVKAEQIFAQGIMLGDVDGAKAAFDEVVDRYPSSNAADNAYSWMQIVLTCAGRKEEAKVVNDDIIRLFPMTRHAIYAQERRGDPDRWAGDECGEYLRQPLPDYEEEAEEAEEE